MVTVVLYNADEVVKYNAEIPNQAQRLLPLTPSAKAAIIQCALHQTHTLIDPLLAHSNQGHCRDIIRRNQLEKFLDKKLNNRFLSQAGKQVLIDYSLDACGISSRIWTILRMGGPWLILGNETWQTIHDRSQAHQLLLQRLLQPLNDWPLLQEIGKTPFRVRVKLFFYNVCFALLVRATKPLFFNSFARGFAELAKQIAAVDPNVWLLSFNPLNANTDSPQYIKTWLSWVLKKQPLPNRQVTFMVPPRRLPLKVALANRVLNTIQDPIAKAGVEALRDYIVRNVEWVESLGFWYRIILRCAGARAVLTWDTADRLNAMLAESAQKVGVPSIGLCHTSISPAVGKASLAAKMRRTRVLSASLVDMAYVQSPHAEAAVVQCAPTLPRKRIQPIVFGHQLKEPITKRPQNGKRVIVHASNYFEWSAYLPWAYETSNDFIDNLTVLTRAIAAHTDTHLIVRMKSNFARKGEFSTESLQTLLPQGQWEIREDGSFYQDLEEADLVVSFHSTTIDEAIMARCPVLLLGGNLRYRHIPARRTPPTFADRAAVYAPGVLEELPAFIDAILSAHAGVPLTDAEVSAHIWPVEVPGVATIAQELVENDFKKILKGNLYGTVSSMQ